MQQEADPFSLCLVLPEKAELSITSCPGFSHKSKGCIDHDSYRYTVDAAALTKKMSRRHNKSRDLMCTCESLTRDIELIQASFKNLGAFHTLEDTRIGGIPIVCCPKCFSTRMVSRRHLAKTKHSVVMWHQMVVTRACARSALNPPRSESRLGALQHKHRV